MSRNLMIEQETVTSDPSGRVPLEQHEPAAVDPPGSDPLATERHRMMTLGPDPLANIELLALVVGGEQAIAQAVALFDHNGGLMALERAHPRQIGRTPGVDPAAATAIAAALELGRRVSALDFPYARPIEHPGDLTRFLCARIGSASQEMFLVLGLDVRRRLQLVRTVAMGSLTRVHVEPRDVFRPLVQAGVDSVIVAHNHPSGAADPSDEDVALTHCLVKAGRVIGIPVLDHLVVTRSDTTSLAELGLLGLPGRAR